MGIFYNKDKFNLVDYFTPLPDNKDMGIGFINECWEAGFFTQEEYDHLVWEKENLLYHTKNFCLGVFQEKSTGRVFIGFWDPLGATDLDFWGLGEEGTIGYLRHAEIKHGEF